MHYSVVARPICLYPLSVENVANVENAEMIAAADDAADTAAAVVMVRICHWVASSLHLHHDYHPYYCSTFDQMTENLVHCDVKHHLDYDDLMMVYQAGVSE